MRRGGALVWSLEFGGSFRSFWLDLLYSSGLLEDLAGGRTFVEELI